MSVERARIELVMLGMRLVGSATRKLVDRIFATFDTIVSHRATAVPEHA